MRYLEDTITYDGDLARLSDAAYRIWTKMLVLSDDFGILPGDPDELCRILLLPESSRSLLIDSVNELLPGIGRLFIHREKPYFSFKPDSFDRIQHQVIRNRTRSRYLKEDKDQAFDIRASAWTSQGSINRMQNPAESSCKKLSRARSSKQKAISISSSSPEKEKQKRYSSLRAQPADPPPEKQNGHAPVSASQPVSLSDCSSIPAAVVQILHRLGAATGLPAYQHISEQSWTPTLHTWGQKIGYACLLAEALKFEQWFLGQYETGKGKPSSKPNPRSRFFNNWLSRVDPKFYTPGDHEHSFPRESTPSDYAHLVRTAD